MTTTRLYALLHPHSIFDLFQSSCYWGLIEACSRFNMAVPAPGSDSENTVYWIYSGNVYGDLIGDFSVPAFSEETAYEAAEKWTAEVMTRVRKLATKTCIANGYPETYAEQLERDYLSDILFTKYYSDSRDQFMLTVFRDLQAADIEGYSNNTHIATVLLG